jgi:hypothetical protein
MSALLLMKEEVSTLFSFFVEAMLKQHERFVDKVTIGYLPLQKSEGFLLFFTVIHPSVS